MAALLLGWRTSVIVTIASIISGFGLAYAEQVGIKTQAFYPPMSLAQDNIFLFGLNILLIYLLINGLENEIKKSRKNLDELKEANINLNNVQIDLEKRTVELNQRRMELESANKQIHRRAANSNCLRKYPNPFLPSAIFRNFFRMWPRLLAKILASITWVFSCSMKSVNLPS